MPEDDNEPLPAHPGRIEYGPDDRLPRALPLMRGCGRDRSRPRRGRVATRHRVSSAYAAIEPSAASATYDMPGSHASPSRRNASTRSASSGVGKAAALTAYTAGTS